MKPSHPYDLLIGLDRSDAKADLCLLDTHTGLSKRLTLSTTPESLFDWLAAFRAQHPEARVALCVEQPALNVIAFLEPYAWITIFAVNPITLQKFREAFVTSRAKDDTKDADFLAQLLLLHRDKLKAWVPEEPDTRRLQQLVAHRRATVDERTALSNRLKALLKQYFPQALTLCGEELWRPLATRLLLKWPSLQSLQKVRPATLRQFYHLQGSRSATLLDERFALLSKAVALTDDPALVDTFAVRVQLICRQLDLLVRAIAQFDRHIAEAFAAHPDRLVFENLPGAGPVLAPRLLASLGAQRERFPTSASLQRYSGIAPVTKQSGGKRHVHRRYQCPLFHRQSFHEYAKESVLHSRWAAAFYHQQRSRGARHNTAVRALAYKWQRVIWRCWQNRVAYSDAHYEAALRRRNSPLTALLEGIQLGKSPMKSNPKKPQKVVVGSPQR